MVHLQRKDIMRKKLSHTYKNTHKKLQVISKTRQIWLNSLPLHFLGTMNLQNDLQHVQAVE